MLPLSNRETLDLWEIDPAVMTEACRYCTGYLSHILDRVTDNDGSESVRAHTRHRSHSFHEDILHMLEAKAS